MHCLTKHAIHCHYLFFLQIYRIEFWTEISSFFNNFLAVFIICELLKAINESFLFPLSLCPLADINSKKESLNIRKQRLRTRSIFFVRKLCVLCAYSVLCRVSKPRRPKFRGDMLINRWMRWRGDTKRLT